MACCDCHRQSSQSRSGTSAQAGWRGERPLVGPGGELGGSSPSGSSGPAGMATRGLGEWEASPIVILTLRSEVVGPHERPGPVGLGDSNAPDYSGKVNTGP